MNPANKGLAPKESEALKQEVARQLLADIPPMNIWIAERNPSPDELELGRFWVAKLMREANKPIPRVIKKEKGFDDAA